MSFLHCQRTFRQIPDVGFDLNGAVSVIHESIEREEYFRLESNEKRNQNLLDEDSVKEIARKLSPFGITTASVGTFRMVFIADKDWVLKCVVSPSLECVSE